MTHELKVWPEYFKELFIGAKTFEVRYNDRDYRVGDKLVLKEYVSVLESNQSTAAGYTGRIIISYISYILSGGQFGIEPGYVVMGLSKTKPENFT